MTIEIKLVNFLFVFPIIYWRGKLVMEIMEITASLKTEVNGIVLNFDIVPKKESKIMKQNLLSEKDMPKDFCEVSGFRRVDEREALSNYREVLFIAKNVVPVLSALGLGRPLLWICGRNHAAWYERYFPKLGFDIIILRGSLREDNPYEMLSQTFGEQGGSEDEHIIMLIKK